MRTQRATVLALLLTAATTWAVPPPPLPDDDWPRSTPAAQGGVILISSLLRQRTGLHADAFADRYLFEPLGITRTDWFRNREGHPHTGGGLDLRPRNMAKLGLLYLRQGRWGERQVVPAEVVVVTGGTRGYSEEVRPLGFLYSHILPSVRG